VLANIMGTYASQGDPNKAIERGLEQLKVSPNNARIYILLGQASVMAKDLTQAEAYFNKAVESDPNQLQAYMSLGEVYQRQGNPRKAIDKLEAMIKVKPDFAPAYAVLGTVHEGLKEYDKAKARYEQALKINPKFGPAANNLAWLYAEQGGNIDTALGLAQIAREQLPQDAHVADTLGWVYYKKTAYLRAISFLKEAAEKVPDNPTIQYHLGMAYYKNGDKAAAKKTLEVSLKLSGNYSGSEEAKKVLQQL
jgi:tetratricopeptide (TPR) repeat protein